MLKLLHIWGSYAFIFIFLSTALIGLLSLLRRDAQLQRWSAWGFVFALLALALPYSVGFALKDAFMAEWQAPAIEVMQKHHNLSKFVLTGCILTASAAALVLHKYKNQPFPNWFLPNLLFLSLMIVSFSARSLVSAWRIPAATTLSVPHPLESEADSAPNF